MVRFASTYRHSIKAVVPPRYDPPSSILGTKGGLWVLHGNKYLHYDRYSYLLRIDQWGGHSSSKVEFSGEDRLDCMLPYPLPPHD